MTTIPTTTRSIDLPDPIDTHYRQGTTMTGNTERDELAYTFHSDVARVIHTEHCLELVHSAECTFWHDDHVSADAILAAGYTKPRQVTTVEELDALPSLSVVLDKYGESFQKLETDEGAASKLWRSGDIVVSELIALPATVLHEGTQP